MKCIINDFQKVERDGQLPYYIVRARGTQGDENAEMFVNGAINFAAVQSRVFNFTKCLFPGTENQCNALEAGIQVGETVIYLDLFQWETGKKFYIKDRDGNYLTEVVQEPVTMKATSSTIINGKAYKAGDTYTVLQDVEKPKVFTRISLTLLCDPDGNIQEGGGNAEAIARRNWETGLSTGTYEIVE